jgi:hypothetical protein
MKVSEPTDVEQTSAAADAARVQLTVWASRRQGLEQRAVALTADLAQVVADLTAARKAALAGEADPKTSSALSERRRALEAEQVEVAEIITLAKAEEAAAGSIHQQLARVADVAQLKANAAAAAAKAAEIEQQIDQTFGQLCELLQARWDLETGFLATAQMAQRQDEILAGQGLDLVGGIAGSRFDWRRIPSVNNPRGRYSLPGGA